MKRLMISALAAFSFSAVAAQAEKTETFKVYGNCGMCEKRIEKAAKIDGVIKADWNNETQVMSVVFNSTKTNLEKVQKAIASVGHDTDKEKASDAVYKKLPGCCKYERKLNVTTNDNR